MIETVSNVGVASLEQQLSAAMIRHPHLYQRQVFFRADQGHVVLQGRVKSFFEKQLAQEALRSIDGISSIDNQLEVSWAE
jgi:osmotically-inducible protein OsmY